MRPVWNDVWEEERFPGESPDYELVIGTYWEQFVNGGVYDAIQKDQQNAEQELINAIDQEIVDELIKAAGVSSWSKKLNYMWDASLEDRIEPIGVIAPVYITPEVEITPDEMKSDLWQAIANPILTKLRLSHPVPTSPSWSVLRVTPSSLPDTSTLRMAPSTYRRLLPSKTLKKALPTEKDNTTFPLVPELSWYSLDDYPEPLTYGSILTNAPVSVSL